MWPSTQESDKIAVRGKEAAQLLGVSKPTLLQWAKRPDFKAAFTIGGCTLYSVDKLREWVSEQAEEYSRARTFDSLDIFSCIECHVDKNDPKSFVYFIDDGTFLKIGKANDVFGRKKSIQTGNGKKLSVAYVIPCKSSESAYAVESLFHKLYEKYRMEGEWFDIRDKLDPDSFSTFKPEQEAV